MSSSQAVQQRPRGRRAPAATLERPTRAERVAAIEALERRGYDVLAIAGELGLSPKTIYAYRRDPDGSRQRERHKSYRGHCGRCGSTTHGSEGRAGGPQWCPSCAPLARRRWSDEQLLAAIRDWTALTGTAPTTYDWSPAHAPAGHPGAARYLREHGRWPNLSSVARRFGSLAVAVERAGLAGSARC